MHNETDSFLPQASESGITPGQLREESRTAKGHGGEPAVLTVHGLNPHLTMEPKPNCWLKVLLQSVESGPQV